MHCLKKIQPKKIFDNYKEEILSIYEKNNYNKLNINGVYDYLEEKFIKLMERGLVDEASIREQFAGAYKLRCKRFYITPEFLNINSPNCSRLTALLYKNPWREKHFFFIK